MTAVKTAVVIGVDPAKRSHAMAVLDRQEEQLAALQVTNDSAGYRAMLSLAKRWRDRVWAIEGAGGVGLQLAQRLVADGETVLDVPPKLSTRARIFDRGHGRKNDPVDARTTAVVALRTKGLREVVADDEMVALRLMSERRRDLVATRTATINHLHQLLMELIPAGDDRKLTAVKAQALLATVRPRDVAGRTRRQLAVDLVEDLVALDRKLKDLDKRLKDAVEQTGTGLLEIKGIGVATAARSSGRSETSGASPAGTTSRPTPAPPRASTPPAASTPAGSAAPATASSTTRCTSSRCRTSATTNAAPSTTPASSRPARARRAPCAASSAACRTSSSANSCRTGRWSRWRAREGSRGRLQRPARLTEPRRSALRTSHSPDPPDRTLRRNRGQF